MPGAAYLITFGTYGARLHGDDRGSFRRKTGVEAPNAPLRVETLSRMRGAPMPLDVAARRVVLDAMVEVAQYRSWQLLAAHVRTEHVHCVVSAAVPAERMMVAFKAWATRALRAHAIVDQGARVWADHGSTRWLWTEHDVAEAADYVFARQGEVMARVPY